MAGARTVAVATRLQCPEVERFWSKVTVGEPDECWPWTAALDGTGYGSFGLDGRRRLAHRVAYELTIGEIPAGLEIDHLCRNRACQNPMHMEPVTHRTNTLRGETITARLAAKSTCPYGHDYVITPSGRRRCYTCEYDRRR